ncbi:MAG: CBS domain-containing protein [Rhizobacter sp.]|nr:CBS domain-containing protein [Bacteriovorax sp.]
MDVRNFMRTEVPLCTPLTSIENIKKLMEEKSTDEVMVVDTILEKHLIGTISVNDIYAKSISNNVPATELNAEQCIRSYSVTVRETTTPEECKRVMDLNHMTRIAVVDDQGHVCGMIESSNLMRH